MEPEFVTIGHLASTSNIILIHISFIYVYAVYGYIVVKLYMLHVAICRERSWCIFCMSFFHNTSMK